MKRRKRALAKLAGYFVKWLVFWAIWFLFVYQASAWEALAGAGAAALTLFALEKTRKYEPLRFRPRAHWVAQAWRLPEPIVVYPNSAVHPGIQAVRRLASATSNCAVVHLSGENPFLDNQLQRQAWWVSQITTAGF